MIVPFLNELSMEESAPPLIAQIAEQSDSFSWKTGTPTFELGDPTSTTLCPVKQQKPQFVISPPGQTKSVLTSVTSAPISVRSTYQNQIFDPPPVEEDVSEAPLTVAFTFGKNKKHLPPASSTKPHKKCVSPHKKSVTQSLQNNCELSVETPPDVNLVSNVNFEDSNYNPFGDEFFVKQTEFTSLFGFQNIFDSTNVTNCESNSSSQDENQGKQSLPTIQDSAQLRQNFESSQGSSKANSDTSSPILSKRRSQRLKSVARKNYTEI